MILMKARKVGLMDKEVKRIYDAEINRQSQT